MPRFGPCVEGGPWLYDVVPQGVWSPASDTTHPSAIVAVHLRFSLIYRCGAMYVCAFPPVIL
jgi:hypothetical protein